MKGDWLLALSCQGRRKKRGKTFFSLRGGSLRREQKDRKVVFPDVLKEKEGRTSLLNTSEDNRNH